MLLITLLIGKKRKMQCQRKHLELRIKVDISQIQSEFETAIASVRKHNEQLSADKIFFDYCVLSISAMTTVLSFFNLQ